MFGVSKEEGIPLGIFLNIVGQLKFRGTSVLFRLPRSPVVKKTGVKNNVRALSPGPEVAPGSLEHNEETVVRPVKAEKRVFFVGLEKIGEREEHGEEKMEVGGREEVDGGWRGKGGGGEGVEVVPDETLPLNLPMLKVGRGEGKGEGTEVYPEEREFSIATHFVKASRRWHTAVHVLPLSPCLPPCLLSGTSQWSAG